MTARVQSIILTFFILVLTLSSGLNAQTSQPDTDTLKRMIEKSADYDDGQHFLATLMMAIATTPSNADELTAFALSLKPDAEVSLLEALQVLPGPVQLPDGNTPGQRLDALKQAKAAEPEPGFFAPSTWDGELSAGGSFLTGNTEEKALTLGVKLDRISDEWEHHFNIQADYSRNANRTTKQRILADYGNKWFYLERGYIFSLADFDLDTFSEFDWRLSEAGGLGYRLFESQKSVWDIEGGPGARQTKLAANGVENEFIFVARSNYTWQLRENMNFTDTVSVFIGSERTTFTNNAALTANLTERLSGRLGLHIKYDSSVPFGQEKLDTATRATLVYGF